MKKVLCVFGVLVISFFSLLPTSLLAASEIDQQFTTGAGSVKINSLFGRFAQTFMPTKTRLDKVEIELTDVVDSKSVTVSVRHNVVGIGWDEGDVATVPNQVITNGWNTFDFDDVTTTVSDTETYGIWVVCPEDGPQWKYKGGPSEYDRGYAIWQNNDMVDWDYNFKTYGYNPTPDTPTPTGNQGTTGTTGTTGTGEALGTTTTSIAKPTNLVATYSDTSGSRGIKLTWKATTTTDIDGYKVFRSEKSTTGYLKVADTKKDKVEYLDQDVVAGKTYYYQVRAYKGGGQSVSSNTASATVPADAPPAKPQGLKVSASTETTLKVAWKANTETNLAGYTITLYKDKDLVKTAEVAKDQTTYDFSGLTSGTSYKITLTSKNDKDKSSDPAEVVGATTFVPEKYSWFNIYTIVGGILILGLAGFLVYRIIKRKRGSKIKE